MLDDLKRIDELDKADTLGIAERQWQQLGQEFDINQGSVMADNIVYSGMGGSALAALVSTVWPAYDRPFEVVRGYDIPAYVSPKTFFIASSYSGNTEETLEALRQAEGRGAQIAVIAGGGQLADIAREKGYALVTIPKVEQPRYAVLYNLKGLVQLLKQAGLLAADDAEAQLTAAAEFLKQSVTAWAATVPTANNPAKQLALEMVGKSVVIYGGPKLWPAAYKWKISFNENAKQVAWWGQYPEFNHNEFIGWSQQPVDKPYAVVDLRAPAEGARINQRFALSDKLLSGRRPAAHEVMVRGSTLLEQMLWAINFGDMVTLYTALLNGLNPAPVDLVEDFKRRLAAGEEAPASA